MRNEELQKVGRETTGTGKGIKKTGRIKNGHADNEGKNCLNHRAESVPLRALTAKGEEAT